MNYNDYLDTDVPYADNPAEYTPTAPSTPDKDAVHRLQERITGAFRNVAGSTIPHAHLSTEQTQSIVDSTGRAITEAVDARQALFQRYCSLPDMVRLDDHEQVTAEFREVIDAGRVDGTAAFESMITRLRQTRELVELGSFGEAQGLAHALRGETEVAIWQNNQLLRAIEGLESSVARAS